MSQQQPSEWTIPTCRSQDRVACQVAGLPSFCGVISNAGKARLQGAELETTARLGRDLFSGGDRLTLSGTLGYIDAKYKEYITNIGGTPTDVANFREVQNTPAWTTNAALGYLTPVGAGDLSLNTSVTYRSKTYQFELPNPYIDQKGYALWDASIVYSAPGNRLEHRGFRQELARQTIQNIGLHFRGRRSHYGRNTARCQWLSKYRHSVPKVR